jgi:ribosomal protein S18 acetylase RimI-like enzyme
MLYGTNVHACICLCLTVTAQICTATLNSYERIETMDNKEMKNDWLNQVKKSLGMKTSGSFAARDASGNPIMLEWLATDIVSPQLAAFKKQVSDLAAQNTAATEVAFLRKHPGAVEQEFLLKPCAPLFAKGVAAVDWKQVEETIRSTIKQFYLTDISSFGAAVIKPLLDDLYFGVVAKDPRGTLLGFAMFSITPALAFGDVKLIHVSVDHEAQNRELENLLVASIVKLIPQTTHIFTGVRPTDTHAVAMFTACGFKPEAAPQDQHHKVNVEYFTVLGYTTESSPVLQNLAEQLIW